MIPKEAGFIWLGREKNATLKKKKSNIDKLIILKFVNLKFYVWAETKLFLQRIFSLKKIMKER
jgi:hypothetical protein